MWRQEELLEHLAAAGLTRSTSWLSRLENGKGGFPRRADLTYLARVLGVSVDDLMRGEGGDQSGLRDRLAACPELAAAFDELTMLYSYASPSRRRVIKILLANLTRTVAELGRP